MILVTHQVQLITDCQNVIILNQGKIYKRGTFDQLNLVEDSHQSKSNQEILSEFDGEKDEESSELDESSDSDKLSALNIQNISINLEGIRSLSKVKQRSVTDPLNKNEIKIPIMNQN